MPVTCDCINGLHGFIINSFMHFYVVVQHLSIQCSSRIQCRSRDRTNRPLALTSTAAWPPQLAQARLIVSPVSLSTTQVTCTTGSPPDAGRAVATHSLWPLTFLPPLLSVDQSCQQFGQPPEASAHRGLPPAAPDNSSLCRTQQQLIIDPNKPYHNQSSPPDFNS